MLKCPSCSQPGSSKVGWNYWFCHICSKVWDASTKRREAIASQSEIKADTEFRNCRAPKCQFKAPVCEYGYCWQCCKREHSFYTLGKSHQPPECSGTQNVEIKTVEVPIPMCGTWKPVETTEFWE